MISVKVKTILGFKQIIGRGEVSISLMPESSLKDLLAHMVDTWGDELGSSLFDARDGTLLGHIRLIVNGRDIAFLDNLQTILRDGDEVLILPPVAGG